MYVHNSDIVSNLLHCTRIYMIIIIVRLITTQFVDSNHSEPRLSLINFVHTHTLINCHILAHWDYVFDKLFPIELSMLTHQYTFDP